MYLVTFLRFSLKPGVRAVQGHWKWGGSYDFLLVRHLYHFRVIWRWIIVTLKSGLEVTEGQSNWYHSKAWMRFSIRLP